MTIARVEDTWHERDGRKTHLSRLTYTPTDDGRVLWVDFQIFEVAGETDGSPIFGTSEQWRELGRYPTEPFDPIVEGYTKWDGCTQFRFRGEQADPIHYDDPGSLHEMMSALCATIEAAQEAMGESRDDHTPWTLPEPPK